MTETLHPAVEHLLNSGLYDCRHRVEVFTEHEIKGKDGKIIKVDKARLEKIAQVGNEKAKTGNLSLAGPGHTYDDSYGPDGKLIAKFPEEKQPKPWGAYHKYEVAKNPSTGKYSLYVDEYVKKTIRDPETGKNEPGLEYTATFPRRSSEIWHKLHWIDWVASLRRAPELDMGLVMHAKQDPDHTRYAMFEGREPAVAIDMGNPMELKTRYSADTAGEVVGPEAADPTQEPQARGAQVPPEAVESSLPPEHMEAAEKYAMHSHGMHHSRVKALMGHLHTKYGKECGMDENMMTPHAAQDPKDKNAMLSGTSTMPTPEAKSKPAESAPPREKSKMELDQAAIEKDRYEKRINDLETRVKAAEERAAVSAESEQHARYERELLQLVYEGFEVDAAAELEFCTKRKYSREQFDDHVGLLRRLPKRIDHEIGPVDSAKRVYEKPGGKSDEPTEDQFMRYQRAIRNGHTEEEARTKYLMPERNGVAK